MSIYSARNRLDSLGHATARYFGPGFGAGLPDHSAIGTRGSIKFRPAYDDHPFQLRSWVLAGDLAVDGEGHPTEPI